MDIYLSLIWSKFAQIIRAMQVIYFFFHQFRQLTAWFLLWTIHRFEFNQKRPSEKARGKSPCLKITKNLSYNIWRENQSSLSQFHAGPLVELEFGTGFSFLWREENRSTRLKTLGAKREPTTYSTLIWYRAGIEF